MDHYHNYMAEYLFDHPIGSHDRNLVKNQNLGAVYDDVVWERRGAYSCLSWLILDTLQNSTTFQIWYSHIRSEKNIYIGHQPTIHIHQGSLRTFEIYPTWLGTGVLHHWKLHWEYQPLSSNNTHVHMRFSLNTINILYIYIISIQTYYLNIYILTYIYI